MNPHFLSSKTIMAVHRALLLQGVYLQKKQSLSNWISIELSAIRMLQPKSAYSPFRGVAEGAEPTSKAVDMDKDGVMDSHDGVGCRMSGSLKVQKSPGMIKIQVSPLKESVFIGSVRTNATSWVVNLFLRCAQGGICLWPCDAT